MTKHIAIITTAIVIAAAAVTGTCIYTTLTLEHQVRQGEYDAGYDDGYAAGVLHVIEDSEIWTTERYDPEDPDSSAWGEYDQRIIIELDGELYEHGMYQG